VASDATLHWQRGARIHEDAAASIFMIVSSEKLAHVYINMLKSITSQMTVISTLKAVRTKNLMGLYVRTHLPIITSLVFEIEERILEKFITFILKKTSGILRSFIKTKVISQMLLVSEFVKIIVTVDIQTLL
jgi:hypothetical protein